MSDLKVCKRGHEQIPENTVQHGGRTRCRLCCVFRCNEWRRNNKERHNELRRNWASRHPARQRDAVLRAKFGITLEEYNRKAANQNHLCAICGKPEPSKQTLSVDHDHKTSQVRDLLCSRCNPSLGGFMDSPELLLKAYEYLLRWKQQLKDNFYGTTD